MSYEGYDQHLCASGHYFTVDAMEHYGLMDKAKCPTCGAESAWSMAVDQTNDEGFPYGNFVQIKGDKHETCEHCNHTKVVSEATYRIPTKEEIEQHEQEREKFYKDMCGAS